MHEAKETDKAKIAIDENRLSTMIALCNTKIEDPDFRSEVRIALFRLKVLQDKVESYNPEQIAAILISLPVWKMAGLMKQLENTSVQISIRVV